MIWTRSGVADKGPAGMRLGRLLARAGGMRIIVFIDQPDVIEKILTHLGLWPHTTHASLGAKVPFCAPARLKMLRKPCLGHESPPESLDRGRGKR